MATALASDTTSRTLDTTKNTRFLHQIAGKSPKSMFRVSLTAGRKPTCHVFGQASCCSLLPQHVIRPISEIKGMKQERRNKRQFTRTAVNLM